jgi:hypothetical protein
MSLTKKAEEWVVAESSKAEWSSQILGAPLNKREWLGQPGVNKWYHNDNIFYFNVFYVHYYFKIIQYTCPKI